MHVKALKIGIKKAMLSLLAVVFFYLALYLLFPVLLSDRVSTYVSEVGVFGPILLVIFEFLSRIIPPISGAPGVILGMTTYGVRTTCVIIYLGSLGGASFNFFLANKLGKTLVEKVLRKKYSAKFYKYINSRATLFLIIGVIIGFSFIDLLAYLIGLTKMSFKKFFLLYSFSSLVPVGATYFIFKNSDMKDINNLTIWFIYVSVLSVIFAVWFEIQEHSFSEKAKIKKV